MEIFISLLAIFIVWKNSSRIEVLEKESRQIKDQLAKFLKSSEKPNDFTAANKVDQQSSDMPETEIVAAYEAQVLSEEKAELSAPDQSIKESKPKISFEQRFGARLPVWIGGMALALAGLFMVKYSIETGLLTEKIRIILSGLFGVGLLYLSSWITTKKNIANGEKISQALAGAAIVDLYGCIYAATSLYNLIPSFIGFLGMTAITFMAIIMSLRYGPSIAIFGLIGGFLTPALASSSQGPNAPTLFIYLYLILAGFFIIIRKQNWWLLSIPTILGVFLWVAIWLVTEFTSSDSFSLGLFLIAVCATVAFASSAAIESGIVDKVYKRLSFILNYLTLGGSATLMALVIQQGNSGFIEWGLFGLLALGSIVLSHFKQKIYELAPLITAAICAIMLLVCNASESIELAIIIASFLFLYIIAGYYFMWRAENPEPWSILVCAVSICYYSIGHYKLHLALENYLTENPSHPLANWPIWGGIAMIASLLAAEITRKINAELAAEEKIRQRLLAIFAITSTAFLSIAFAIEFQKDFWPIVFASQVLAISWINSKVDIKALRKISQTLAIIFILLLTPQILTILQLILNSLAGKGVDNPFSAAMTKWPLIYFGIPAIEFAIASIFLAKQKDDNLVKFLEIAAITLVTIASYYLVRNIFATDLSVLATKAGFAERGIITDAFCAYGVLCLWAGRKFNRNSILLSGAALLTTAMIRIFYFDLMVYNPLLTAQNIGSLPILNALILPYGLPIIASLFANRELSVLKDKFYLLCNNIFALILLLTLLSLNIRQIYHGEYLGSGETTNAETYTYSVAWLLAGIALLFLGTLQKNKMIRMASLALITLTVGKVFLYDASELTGLYRVFSFLGLGISLIGLSWFYTRFISEEKTKTPTP